MRTIPFFTAMIIPWVVIILKLSEILRRIHISTIPPDKCSAIISILENPEPQSLLFLSNGAHSLKCLAKGHGGVV